MEDSSVSARERSILLAVSLFVSSLLVGLINRALCPTIRQGSLVKRKDGTMKKLFGCMLLGFAIAMTFSITAEAAIVSDDVAGGIVGVTHDTGAQVQSSLVKSGQETAIAGMTQGMDFTGADLAFLKTSVQDSARGADPTVTATLTGPTSDAIVLAHHVADTATSAPEKSAETVACLGDTTQRSIEVSAITKSIAEVSMATKSAFIATSKEVHVAGAVQMKTAAMSTIEKTSLIAEMKTAATTTKKLLAAETMKGIAT